MAALSKQGNLIMLFDKDNDPIGLYNVPANLTAEEFRREFQRFDRQHDFDQENMIGAERVIIDYYFDLKPAA